MPSSMEDLVNFQSSKLENLLKELESKKITPGRSVDRYHILLAEKILHALDIPFLVDGNYSATPTVAEELCLCPSSSLIPQISKRDLKFGSDQPSYKSDIEGDVKSACAAAIWTFSQSISVAIRETLGNAPLPTQPGSPFSDGQPTNAWNCSSFLSFLGASRFVPQLWDFCCTGYCIAEATLASNTEPRWRDQGMGEVFVPVVIISPHLSIITDLGEFAGNYAYSRYCFENEIRLKTLRQCADESMMSMRSFNDSDNGDLSITSDAPHVSDPYDPSPWIQWCSSIAAGCTNIDTPTVSLDQSGQHHRHVVVTSSGPVKLDDMVRLRSAWSCI